MIDQEFVRKYKRIARRLMEEFSTKKGRDKQKAIDRYVGEVHDVAKGIARKLFGTPNRDRMLKKSLKDYSEKGTLRRLLDAKNRDARQQTSGYPA